MRKLFPQLVAIFLVSCLIADPSLAAALSYQRSAGEPTFNIHTVTKSSLFYEQTITAPAVGFIKPFAVLATVGVIIGMTHAAHSYPHAIPMALASIAFVSTVIAKIIKNRTPPRKIGMIIPFLGAGPLLLYGIAGITAWFSMPFIFPMSIALTSIGLQVVMFWGIRLNLYRTFTLTSKIIFIRAFSVWRFINVGFFIYIIGLMASKAAHVSAADIFQIDAIWTDYFGAATTYLVTIETIAHEIYVLGEKAVIGKRIHTRRGGFIGREIGKLSSRLAAENIQLLRNEITNPIPSSIEMQNRAFSKAA